MQGNDKTEKPYQEQIPEETPSRKNVTNWSTWQLAWELGYTISIPIVLFALLGRWADKTLGTSPWLLLAGILFSIVVSSTLVYKKVSKILH